MLPVMINAAVTEDTGNAYSLTLSILVIVLLLVLLVLREFLQAARKDSLRTRIDILNIAIVPLLLAFGVLVLLRAIELISVE